MFKKFTGIVLILLCSFSLCSCAIKEDEDAFYGIRGTTLYTVDNVLILTPNIHDYGDIDKEIEKRKKELFDKETELYKSIIDFYITYPLRKEYPNIIIYNDIEQRGELKVDYDESVFKKEKVNALIEHLEDYCENFNGYETEKDYLNAFKKVVRKYLK